MTLVVDVVGGAVTIRPELSPLQTAQRQVNAAVANADDVDGAPMLTPHYESTP